MRSKKVTEIESRAQEVEKGNFWKLLGMEVTDVEEGEATVKLLITPKLLQLYGHVHGGVLAAIVDGAIGVAAQSTLAKDDATATIDLHVKYAKPIGQGYLIGKGSIVRQGKTIIFGECRVLDNEDNLIAFGSATYIVLNKQRWGKPK